MLLVEKRLVGEEEGARKEKYRRLINARTRFPLSSLENISRARLDTAEGVPEVNAFFRRASEFIRAIFLAIFSFHRSRSRDLFRGDNRSVFALTVGVR